MNYKKLIYTFLLFAFLSIHLFAQENTSLKKQVNLCNSETALQLVENQVIESNKKIELIKQIKTLLRAAEFTWELNEEKARSYYQNSFIAAKKYFAENGFVNKDIVKSGKSRIYQPQPDYRLEVIRSIAKKDGKWARKLTLEILEEYKKNFEDRNSNEKNKELFSLVRIASENVENNPELSKYLFQQVMKFPLDSHWYWALKTLTRTNQIFADNLYKQLLVVYSSETPRRMLFLSAYPFNRSRIMGIDKMQYSGGTGGNFSINTEIQIGFANIFFNRINVLSENPAVINQKDEYRMVEPAYMVSGLNDLEPYVLESLPQLLPAFRIAKARANAMLTVENRKKLESRIKQYSRAKLTFAERLEELEDSENEGKLKDAQIIRMILGLRKEENFEKMSSWLDKIKDEKAKEDTVNFFYHRRSSIALKAKNYDRAKEYADKVPELEFRALLYFNIVKQQSKNYNDSAEVRQRLIEVTTLARKTNASVSKAQVLLGLAFMYEKIDQHYDALSEIGEAVNVINKLEKPEIFSSSIGRAIAAKGIVYYASYSTPGYNLETAFKTVSKKDFNLTLAHAQSLNDSYFQTLAVLAIAKNCVENTKKKGK